jgi:hypothetical protein
VLSAADVARAFEVGSPRGELDLVVRGPTNPLGIRRLVTERGTFAVKISAEAPRAAALAIERAAAAAGLPLPPTIDARAGGAAARIGAGWVRVHAWVDGEPGRWGEVDARAATEAGGLLARMHRLVVDAEHLVRDGYAPLGVAGWRDLADRARARGVEWAALLAQKIRWLVELERHVAERAEAAAPVAPSHRDLHPPNVLRRPDGTVAVVDWDGAGPAPASAEAAKFAVVWATAARRPPARALVHAFLSGYAAAGGAFDPTRELHAYELETRLAWISLNVRRDAGDAPGADPSLTPALLGAVLPLSPAELARRDALFR